MNMNMDKPTPNITIRPETSSDFPEIARLVLRSFAEGTDYSDGTDVVAFIEEIRSKQYYIPELSFVAEADGQMAGHFMFSHFPLSKTPEGGHSNEPVTDIVMLAPVAVNADMFGRGIGTAMLTAGIAKAVARGYKGIQVEGNYRFYNRFGFTTSSEYGIYPTSGFPMQEPRCMMCMEAYGGSLTGVGGYVVYDMYENA